MKPRIRHIRPIPEPPCRAGKASGTVAGRRRPALALLACALPTLACILAPGHLTAQEPMGMYPGPTVLRAARLLDVETGEMHRDAVIVVEDGLITSVNPASVPDVMHDMDLGDVTLLPGFIDTHTHLGGQVSATSFTDAVTRTEAYET